RGGARPDLRAYLGGHLPEYAVPARIHVLAAIPLTAAGKIDRSRLTPPAAGAAGPGTAGPGTDPGTAGPGTAGGPPATATEKAVAAVFARLLGVESPGREDDFFALGGDS